MDVLEDPSSRRRGFPSKFIRGRFLGKGGFAKCYEVQDQETGEVWAAKIVAKSSITKPRAHAKLKSEIAIHRALDHDKVVKFQDAFEDSEHVYILLELCPNLTLNEFMRKRPNKRLGEPEAMFYLYDLITALKYLHKRRVIHRDLKLGNLFLDHNARIKVGDFGLAAQLEHDGERKRTLCGTPNYIAPEILEGKNGHSYEVDTWSVGVILYTMLYGRPPFETSDVKTTYRRIRYNQYTFPDNVHVAQPARDLITLILKTDPRDRPSLDEILGSTWFNSARSLPPPMPPTVSALAAASPRVNVNVGGSSARSETPERCGGDHARIDSPLPQSFPSRGLSPSSHGIATARTVSARSQPDLAGTTTPCKPGSLPNGRPPLADRNRGNEENVAPNVYAQTDKIDKPLANTIQIQPAKNNNPYMSGQNSQSGASLHSCGSSGRIPPPQAQQAPTYVEAPVPRTNTYNRISSSRESSPLIGSASGSLVQALPGRNVGGSSTSTRASASSPRHNAAVSSGRVASGAPTLKENRSQSARIGVSPSETGAFARTTSNVVSRGGSPPATGRAAQQYLRSRQQLTPRAADGDVHSARTPLAQTAHATGTQSARLNASPFNIEPLQAEPMTPTTGLGRVPSANFRLDSERDELRSVFSSDALLVGATGALPNGGAPELWVTKWVDYSSKYGVGYTLSDGSLGVYFNDSTKIVLSGNQFDYITRRTQEKPEVRTTHSFDEYPDDLKKKVTLLRHFKNYMAVDAVEKKDGATVRESSLPDQHKKIVSHVSGEAPFIKKWTKNKHAILFQLSNKIVQVVFFDKTEAVLSSKSHTVTYMDKRGQMWEYPLSSALDVPNAELAKRLRYTKDILVNLLGVRTGDLPAAA